MKGLAPLSSGNGEGVDMEQEGTPARESRGGRPMKRVFLITPYRAWCGGTRQENLDYLDRCIIDCLGRGETPYAPHKIFPGALDDHDAKDRELGIRAGQAWLGACEHAVCYVDHGVSEGMRLDLAAALRQTVPGIFNSVPLPLSIAFRRLGAPPPTDLWLHKQDVPHRACPLCRIATTRSRHQETDVGATRSPETK